MILATDTCYIGHIARTAGVGFHDWGDGQAFATYKVESQDFAAYEPGAFYKRELPSILKLLQTIGPEPGTIVIDGYVLLDEFGRKGLGAHLYDALDGRVSVIGVAKTAFRGSPHAIPIFRGDSKRALYVTAMGVDLEEAAGWIQSMGGAHRYPTLLKLADTLCREGTQQLQAPPHDTEFSKFRLFSLLALYLGRGLGLVESLELCAIELDGGFERDFVLMAIEAMQKGGELTAACEAAPELLSRKVVTELREGEKDGTLDLVFGKLASQYNYRGDKASTCAQFLQQLSTLILRQRDFQAALESLEHSFLDDRFRRFAQQARSSGDSLGQQMAQHSALFGPTIEHLVLRAEQNGDLAQTLAACADALREGILLT